MSVITHEISLDNFHHQIKYVLGAYDAHGLKVESFQNVIIGGLGGSGIGGRIARLAFLDSFPVPVEVISEYKLPAYANHKTLVILSSYSGNTEETLEMFRLARQKNCQVLAISSGGFLLQWCENENIKCYKVEKGYQPRMALGYSLSFLLLMLGELCGKNLRPELEAVSKRLENNLDLKAKAQDLLRFFATQMASKYIVVCDTAFEAVATRICQQIQENAKGEAFVSVLPESNHNMIECYYGTQDTNFIFLNSGLNPKVDKRFEFLTELLGSSQSRVFALDSGAFSIASIYETIHATDWFSVYLSNAKGVNNMEVPNIARLKNFLDEKQG